MVLDQLSILTYKNLRDVTLELSPGINCLIGNNGEGKTNLLDAVYYLSFCRSSTTTSDRDLVLHGEIGFYLEGRYTHDDGDKSVITCGFRQGRKKSLRRNQKAYQRLSEHIGFIPLIMVTPQDTLLMSQGSDERRRFIDVVISQFDPTYIEALASYNKVLQQRNKLLGSDEAVDDSLLTIYEEQMADYGTTIYHKRDAFIREFIPYFQRIYNIISSNRETITMTYVSHCQRGELLDVIRKDRAKDKAVGYSLHGIHRDDIEVLLDGYNIKHEGSQGQNKTLVLSMKLAQFAFLRRTVSRSTPLLLLDDIFDKLDAQRVEKIISLVASEEYGQIFITDTNRTHIDTILAASHSHYRLFHVHQGTITPI